MGLVIQTCLGLGEDALSLLLNKQLPPARRREVICLSPLTLLPSDLQDFRHLLGKLEWAGHKLSLDLTITDSLKVWVRGKGKSRQIGTEDFAIPVLCHVNSLSASEPRNEPERGTEAELWQRIVRAFDYGVVCSTGACCSWSGLRGSRDGGGKNVALESDTTCPHYLLHFVTLYKSCLFFLRLTFHICEIGITLWTSNAWE